MYLIQEQSIVVAVVRYIGFDGTANADNFVNAQGGIRCRHDIHPKPMLLLLQTNPMKPMCQRQRGVTPTMILMNIIHATLLASPGDAADKSAAIAAVDESSRHHLIHD